MSAQFTKDDGVRVYLTGAVSDGGDQALQAFSLGGFRSSTELRVLGIRLVNPIRGLVVEFASGGNTPGRGVLRAVGPDALAWTPPPPESIPPESIPPESIPPESIPPEPPLLEAGEGEPVEIGDGETVVVSGPVPGAYLRVRRRTGLPLSGYCTVVLTDVHNNAVGMSDVEVGEADYYRAMMIQNVSPGVVERIRLWIPSGASGPGGGVRIALEEPVSGAIQTIADGMTAPVGLMWSEATERLDGPVVEALGPGEMWGVWLHRHVSDEEGASPGVLNEVRFTFDIEEEI